MFTFVYDTRQLGLPSRDGQGIGLVRRTGVLASGRPKYHGRHLKKNSNFDISAADHPIPIYSVFGHRTGFSGSADRIALFPVSPNSIGMREKQCARSIDWSQSKVFLVHTYTCSDKNVCPPHCK